MGTTAIIIGPMDQGRRMSLIEFDQAEGESGRDYELSRGIVTVVEIPHPRHLAQVTAIRRQFAAYDLANPGRIHTIASGGECKISLADAESERHPDLAVYKTPPPPAEEDVWASWVPEIVVEVVSPGSEDRDYVEKREEYLRFGVAEYWIVDAAKGQVLVLRRSRGRWTERVIAPGQLYATHLLPGFELDCRAVFEGIGR